MSLDVELHRAIAAASMKLQPDPPPRVTPYDRPWTRSAESHGSEILEGAENPLPDSRRLKTVPYADKVRARFDHGGTLDTLVMPQSTVERFVIQGDGSDQGHRALSGASQGCAHLSRPPPAHGRR